MSVTSVIVTAHLAERRSALAHESAREPLRGARIVMK
jgi:hypothetical protein